MKIFLGLFFLAISYANALDKNRMAPLKDPRERIPKCFPYACEKEPIHENEIDVSQISIKNFKLRMSEQEFRKNYPKFIAVPLVSDTKGFQQKVYYCADPRKNEETIRKPKSFDMCGVSIGGLHPYNIGLSFVKNKLIQASFYFSGLKSYEDLVVVVSNKFGQPMPSSSLGIATGVPGGFVDGDTRVWELGYKNDDFQASVKMSVIIGGNGAFHLTITDNELINYENNLIEQNDQREKEREKYDLHNRRAKDI
jgi:hypothetical protein